MSLAGEETEPKKLDTNASNEIIALIEEIEQKDIVLQRDFHYYETFA
jgi:hypothetical protein